jgi:hypothetical protein
MPPIESGRFIFSPRTDDADAPLEERAMVISEQVTPLWSEDLTVRDFDEATLIVAQLVNVFGTGILPTSEGELQATLSVGSGPVGEPIELRRRTPAEMVEALNAMSPEDREATAVLLTGAGLLAVAAESAPAPDAAPTAPAPARAKAKP